MNSRYAPNPPRHCRRCSRLVEFRRENKKKFPTYQNAPAATFGTPDAQLLIVGLAPGLHGANKTGIPFTGDFSGDLLFATLEKVGFSPKANSGRALLPCAITNAVRCVPPQNKPIGEEIRNCRHYLKNQIAALPTLRAIVCLGKIAHDSTIGALGMRPKQAQFAHSAVHNPENYDFMLFDSYHCSRYNVNTRRLTVEMFENVFESAKSYIVDPH